MAPTFKLSSNVFTNQQSVVKTMPAPPPPNISDALQQDHHSHSLPDCISKGGTIAEWQKNTYNQNTHVRVHMPDGSDKFFPNVKQDHLQLYLRSNQVESHDPYYDSSATLSRDVSPSADEDSDDEMADATADHPSNQPLFLNFTSDLAPQHLSKKKSKEKKQLQYRVNGVNILNRNSLDMQTAMERLKRRRENHNNVERKRRNNINNTIFEISLLMPTSYRPGAKPNKGSILRRAVEYIKDLQNDNESMRAELNTIKGIPPPPLPPQSNDQNEGTIPMSDYATITNNAAAATSSLPLPTFGNATTPPRGLAPILTSGNQVPLEPASPLILPPPSGLRNLEQPRLKVEPMQPALSNPNSPLIMPGGRNSPESIILPPIPAELAKEFVLPPRASSPLHAAPYLGPPPSTTLSSNPPNTTPPLLPFIKTISTSASASTATSSSSTTTSTSTTPTTSSSSSSSSSSSPSLLSSLSSSSLTLASTTKTSLTLTSSSLTSSSSSSSPSSSALSHPRPLAPSTSPISNNYYVC